MKTNEQVLSSFRERLYSKYFGDHFYIDEERLLAFLSQALTDREREVREETLNEFFQEVDKEFESFTITEAMGKILIKLKGKPSQEEVGKV